ncbi:unnamed protein product [Sphagnum jensenii]|uniref:BHLH transcription factor n=1 Tax=Sphagnum jensenii TaxID=128206 RepID=A0ABP1AGM9_9BRYO
MDKISVLADAISYLKHLKKQVESLQDEVMENDKAISVLGVEKRSLSTVNTGQSEDEEVNGSIKVLELEGTYALQVSCQLKPGSLLQISRALGAVALIIIYSNIMALNRSEQAACTFVAQV